MRSYIATQECCSCGERFKVKYYENGRYEYIEEPCECEGDFMPVGVEPSISEWLESIDDGRWTCFG